NAIADGSHVFRPPDYGCAIASIRNSKRPLSRETQMPPAPASVEVAKDPEALHRRAAGWIADLAAASRDRFAICLSGGSTPRRLYQLLSESPYRDALPWDRVHWFWGDE